jgi:hypothetical protein
VNAGVAQDTAANTNAASTSSDNSVTLDTAGPTLTISQAAGQMDPTNNPSVNFSVLFSEPVTGFTDSDVTAGGTADGTKIATVTGGPTTYNVTVSGATGNGTITATVNAGAIQDTVGNPSGAATGDGLVTLDTTAPTVTGVSSTLADGSYKAGQVIPVTVTFSELVTVTGAPQLTLETGTTDAVVNYFSGSGTTTVIFHYTVAAGHTSADLDYAVTTALALNGGTVKDAVGNNATLTLPALAAAGSLGANKNLIVDTTPPSLTSMSAACVFGSGSNYTCGGTYATASGDLPANLSVAIFKASDNTVVPPGAVIPSIIGGGSWSGVSGTGLANKMDFYAKLTQSDAAGNTTTVQSANFSRG